MAFKILQRLQFRRLQKRVHYQHQTMAWQDIRNILIFVAPTDTQEVNTITQFVDNLKSPNHKIKVIEILKTKKAVSLIPYTYERTRIDAGQTTLLGIPKPSAIESFANQQFDISFDLTATDNVVAQYLACSLNITMRVGLHDANWDCYEFVMAPEQNPYQISDLENILRYLHKIQP